MAGSGTFLQLGFQKKVTCIFAAALSLALSSCTAPQVIGAFTDSAQKALAGGPPLFEDLHDSCVRRETARPSRPILPLFVPPGSKNAPPKDSPDLAACTRFAVEGQALTKVSDVLTAYFRAIQQLSAFNTSTVSAANETSAENAATAAGLNTVQIDSVGKLANFVSEVFTSHYQKSRLVKYLHDADPQVADITQGLETVLKNYEVFLNEEQQTITARYQTVDDSNQPAMLLLLNRAYSDDLAEIQHRRAAADSYVVALTNIREGHHKLVEVAKRMNAKELTLALQPYTSKLDASATALQNGT